MTKSTSLPIIFFKWTIPDLFLPYFSSFHQLTLSMVIRQCCQWLDLNRGPLALKATALRTEPHGYLFFPSKDFPQISQSFGQLLIAPFWSRHFEAFWSWCWHSSIWSGANDWSCVFWAGNSVLIIASLWTIKDKYCSKFQLERFTYIRAWYKCVADVLTQVFNNLIQSTVLS